MNKILYALLLVSASFTAKATQWDIEAGGGGQNGTPYFEPQFLTIMQGDVVEWTWVSGMHSVVSTSGPESFDSGSHSAPFTWSFTFTIPGTYEFECDLFDHADTQFGSIQVEPSSVPEIEPVLAVEFSLFPNPANDLVWIEKNCSCQTDIRIYDITGKTVMLINNVADIRRQLNISGLTQGIYFIELNANGNISRKSLIVK